MKTVYFVQCVQLNASLSIHILHNIKYIQYIFQSTDTSIRGSLVNTPYIQLKYVQFDATLKT